MTQLFGELVRQILLSDVYRLEDTSMPGMNVGGAIAPAFQHMVKVLFRPFELKKWLALGFITALASGSGGNYNFGNWSDYDHGARFPDVASWVAQYWPLLAIGLLFLIVLSLIFAWLASVFHMIYIDDITRSSGAIREPFARLKGLGTSYFLWRLVFGIAVTLLLGVLIALPLVAVFVLARGDGAGLKIAAVIWAVLVGIPLVILAAVIDLFARDFVTPAMYVRNVGVMEGWRTVLPILRANAGQVVLYILLLIAISIGIGLFGLAVFVAAALVLAIPVGLVGALGYLVWQAAHLTWTWPVIAVAIGLGVVVLLGFVYLLECATQPAEVFRRSFSLVVLGQADPSLTTVPTEAAPPASAPQP